MAFAWGMVAGTFIFQGLVLKTYGMTLSGILIMVFGIYKAVKGELK